LSIFGQANALGQRPIDRLVIHISDIHHMADFPALEGQIATENVAEHEGAQIANVGEIVDVANVGEIVDGWAARVDAGNLTVSRLKRLLVTACGVVQLQHWSDTPRLCSAQNQTESGGFTDSAFG